MSPERTEQQAAAVSSRDRDIFLRAGAGTGKTTVLVDRFCAAALDPEGGVERILAFTFTERAADQLRRRIRDELSARIREAEGDGWRPARGARGDRPGLDLDDPRVLPPAARLPPRRRRASIRASESWTRRRPSGSRSAPSTRRSRRWSSRASPRRSSSPRANRRRTLLEMTRGAYDELRSHGDPNPALPQLEPPDTAAAIAALVEAARAAHAECEEASGKSVASRERIARAMELDPALPPDDDLLEHLRGLEIRSTREGLHRRGVRALHEVAQASPGRGGRSCPRARLRAAPRAGGSLRRALRAAQGRPRGTRLRGSPAEGGRAPQRLRPPARAGTASSSTT